METSNNPVIVIEVPMVSIANYSRVFLMPRATHKLTARHKKTPKLRAKGLSLQRSKPVIEIEVVKPLDDSWKDGKVITGTAALTPDSTAKPGKITDLRDIGILDLLNAVAARSAVHHLQPDEK